MTITREQVADLQPGDVVSVSLTLHPGVAVTGPITDDHGTLRCGLVVCPTCGRSRYCPGPTDTDPPICHDPMTPRRIKR